MKRGKNIGRLVPGLLLAVMGWAAAGAERHAGEAPPRSFSWRAVAPPGGGAMVSAVTPARDQYSPKKTGTCWAHVAMGALESMALIDALARGAAGDPGSPDFDFSEYNLVQCGPNPAHSCSAAGRIDDAVAYLTRTGSVLESCAPLGRCFEGPRPCAEDCPRQVTPLGWERLPNDIGAIKEAVYHYGPVMTPFANPGAPFASLPAGAVYARPCGNEPLNHGLVIVGWDDDQAVAEGTTVTGPGAWEVKNSNPRWADQGFGWVAYGAGCIGADASVFTEVQAYRADDQVYSHDEYGPTGLAGDSAGGTEWGLVNFTIAKTGRLNRVEFWTARDAMPYRVRVYGKFNGAKARKLLTGEDGVAARPGYHSIPLTKTPRVYVAGNIYVAVSFESAAGTRAVPVDRKPPFAPGRSFLSRDGKKWRPLANQDVGIRVRVGPDEGGNTPGKSRDRRKWSWPTSTR
jgi:C1A family cysteine protease